MLRTRFLARWKAWAQCDTRIVYRIANAMYGHSPLAGANFVAEITRFHPGGRVIICGLEVGVYIVSSRPRKLFLFALFQLYMHCYSYIYVFV